MKVMAVVAAGVVLAAVAVGYTVHAADRPAPETAPGAIAPGLHVRTADGTVSGTSLSCHRFYAAGDAAVCLAAKPGFPPKTTATVLGRDLTTRHEVEFGGTPNRARVSPSGRMVSWTVFVSGDSYTASGFSTRTGILDTRTGYLVKNMESIQLYLDGRRHHAPDVNFWGVTFAADDNRFYATVATGGRTYLVEGDMAAWTARTLRANAECPSLSPDGTRIAFKKRVLPGADDPWRLHVLDLATLRETPLAETRSVDDQAAWLDDRTLAYALPGPDVWKVPADGSGAPELLAADASSPSMAP
ncbi:TolB family protein [Actinokineospora fastidiosa]|uniref:TolB-like translocation protein signal peptide n=1 Tax=Actinokineospora fastidiosa TaxID=1816 RepID=A0A918GMU7_9PSEU|nr:PD40 domain-containing protein [Actinokineospora fastidiosa]GGS49056.1 TolB-like translocation protein; signal peptide [Actinokineospora fastidiosa]